MQDTIIVKANSVTGVYCFGYSMPTEGFKKIR